jgi:hypothetical protein
LTSPRTSMTQSAAPGSLTISDDPTASTTDVGCHHNCHVRPVPLGHDRRHCRDAPGATAQPPMLRVQCRRPGFGRRRPRPATRRRPTARDITRPAVGCRRQGHEIRPIAIGRAGNASATQSGAGQTDRSGPPPRQRQRWRGASGIGSPCPGAPAHDHHDQPSGRPGGPHEMEER